VTSEFAGLVRPHIAQLEPYTPIVPLRCSAGSSAALRNRS